MSFLVSWPHSSQMGPLEVSSPILAPARPTSESDQALGVLSRGVLSICKDRDLTPSPGILLQCLTTFIGLEFPLLLLMTIASCILSPCSSEKDLSAFCPALPALAAVADSHRIHPPQPALLPAENAQLLLGLLAHRVLQLSTITVPTDFPLSCAQGKNTARYCSRCGFEWWVAGKNTSLDLLANSHTWLAFITTRMYC